MNKGVLETALLVGGAVLSSWLATQAARAVARNTGAPVRLVSGAVSLTARLLPSLAE